MSINCHKEDGTQTRAGLTSWTAQAKHRSLFRTMLGLGCMALCLLVLAPSTAFAQSTCCESQASSGCDTAECEACVCDLDEFCCDTQWDAFCVQEAENECIASCEVCDECGNDYCGSDESCSSCSADCDTCTGSCCESNGTLGCDDIACQLCVCAGDDFCCSVSWDSNCAEGAQQECASTCTDCDVCGNGFCGPDEDCTSCPDDCNCISGYTITSGEADAYNTGSSGGTNRLSKYGGSCTGDYVGSEYAYTFVAPLTGQMKVTLGGADSNTDVLVLAEAANGCDPADCVAQGQGTGSTVTWSAVAGSTYYIVVDRKVAGSANYTLYLHYTAGTCHIPFIETWNRTPFPRAWTLEANWQTSQDSPFGATHAKFTGTPTLTNFERSLTSPVFDTTACPNTQLTVDWRAVPNGSDEGVVMHIEVSSSGGAVWSEIFTYDTTDAEQPPITQVIQSTVLANTALARVRLRITGNTSANLNKIQVDNVKVNAP